MFKVLSFSFIFLEFFQLQTGYMDDFENKISQNISYHSPTRYFSQTFFNKTKDLPVHKESNVSLFILF